MNLELSLQSFEKYWNNKFHENPSSVASCSVRTDGRTDGQYKANNRFSQFANASENKQVLFSTVHEQTWLLFDPQP